MYTLYIYINESYIYVPDGLLSGEHVHACLRDSVCVCACMYICVCECIYICVFDLHVRVCRCVCVCASVCVYQ